MAYWGVRVRITQDVDLIVTDDTQAGAEAKAVTFRTSSQSSDILFNQRFGGESVVVRNTISVSDNKWSKLNARNYVTSTVEKLEAVINDSNIVIDETEYSNLKTKLQELNTLLDSID